MVKQLVEFRLYLSLALKDVKEPEVELEDLAFLLFFWRVGRLMHAIYIYAKLEMDSRKA